MFKSYLLVLSLLAFFGVWMGCSSDASPVSPSNKAVTDDGTGSSTATEITIPDVRLDYAVREKLGDRAPRVTTASLTTAHMLHLTSLDASGRDIANLEGLQHAANLDTLRLGGNSIKNLTPLADLTGLEYLDLQRNGLVDVTPLRNLTNLEELHLYSNHILDVSSLKTLTKLKRFGIGGNWAVGGDYLDDNSLETAVKAMPDLEWLKINGLDLKSLSFLAGLENLENLNISANQGVTDFKPLACLPSLTTLHFRNMPMVAWSTGLDGELLASDDHIQYLISIGVTIRR